MTEPHILIDTLTGTHTNLGRFRLNRPTRLNALSHEMCVTIGRQLIAWANDPNIHAVIIDSMKPGLFCAGGDVLAIHQLGQQDLPKAEQYFKDEYDMNAVLFHFPKPYLAFCDGITMGGGAGISLHGSHPIVTENTRFAMPEAKIGFFTDIGASHFLSRSPWPLGLYLGLTANVINAADMITAGLSSHYLPSEHWPAFIKKLQTTSLGNDPKQKVTDLLNTMSTRPPMESTLRTHHDSIVRCFEHTSLPAIFDALAEENSAWAMACLENLKTLSPHSLNVIFNLLSTAKSFDFDALISRDLTTAKAFLRGQDFYEGIRAQLIDKDKQPRWID